jgi:D-3-phosphoglycerate dehydrogenase
MVKILVSAPYFIPVMPRFQFVFDQYELEPLMPQVRERLSEGDLLQYAGKFDGTICGDDHYNQKVLQSCVPRLKVISKWGTGIDSIDRESAAKLGIQVCNTPNAFTTPVSDSVLGYILAFARKQPWLDREVKSGNWEKIPGRALSESTLGVVGVGNIGKAVIHKAQAFGMRLLGNDIIPIDPNFLQKYGVKMIGLQTLFQQADFISLNCDLNPTSRHLVNDESLRWVKKGAILINTARGPIVDEKSLIQALQNGWIAGAALDVFENEPLEPNSPLCSYENVMLAPHNSNSSPAAWENVHWNTLRNLLLGLNLPLDHFLEFQQTSNPDRLE